MVMDQHRSLITPQRLPVLMAFVGTLMASIPVEAQERRRSARDMGVVVGVLPTGPLNQITDVDGVRVGHVTVTSGDTINTGVTAVLPHGGNIFQQKVPAAFVAGNAFGKFAGTTQIQELGEIESPVVLTCTLCVPRAADAVMTYLLGLPGNEEVRSVNPVIGETNDGFLNRIRLRPITEDDVLTAITEARSGSIEQGSVGAGRGTIAFGWKGGIGTASRRLPSNLGGWTVGVLVQSNHGGVLAVDGAPVGEIMSVGEDAPYPRAGMRNRGEGSSRGESSGEVWSSQDGSIIMVVATDAPLEHRNLARLARRASSGGAGSVAAPAAAIGSPDALRGEIVKAFIVLAHGYEPSNELREDIQNTVRDKLAAYEYPREIEFVEELPMTTTGKVRRVELREAERSRKR